MTSSSNNDIAVEDLPIDFGLWWGIHLWYGVWYTCYGNVYAQQILTLLITLMRVLIWTVHWQYMLLNTYIMLSVAFIECIINHTTLVVTWFYVFCNKIICCQFQYWFCHMSFCSHNSGYDSVIWPPCVIFQAFIIMDTHSCNENIGTGKIDLHHISLQSILIYIRILNIYYMVAPCYNSDW